MTDPELREIVREPARAVGLTVEPELLDVVVADVLGPARRPAAAVDGAGRHLGAAARRPADPGRLPGGGRRRGRADPVGRGGLRRAGRAGRRSWRAGCSCGWPTSTTAGRWSGGRCRSPSSTSTASGADARGGRGDLRRPPAAAVDGDRLEVAHEALLTAWPRLARWLEDDAAGRAVRRHLAPAALEWDGGRPARRRAVPGRPPRPPRWTGRPAPDADADRRSERQFLDASRARAEAELAERPGARPPGGGRPAPDPAARRRAGGRARRRPRRRRAGGALPARGERAAEAERRPSSPTRTGWRRCPRRSGRWTCPSCWRPRASGSPTPRRRRTGCSRHPGRAAVARCAGRDPGDLCAREAGRRQGDALRRGAREVQSWDGHLREAAPRGPGDGRGLADVAGGRRVAHRRRARPRRRRRRTARGSGWSTPTAASGRS